MTKVYKGSDTIKILYAVGRNQAVIKNQARIQVGYGFYICVMYYWNQTIHICVTISINSEISSENYLNPNLISNSSSVLDPCVRHFGNIEVQSSKDSLKKKKFKSALKFEHWGLRYTPLSLHIKQLARDFSFGVCVDSSKEPWR